MTAQSRILAIDTSGPHCAVALLPDEGAFRFEEMKRGQAERLMPLVDEVLAMADTSFGDLDAIAVGIGPGNFTGIRIAVSAARGLALALGIPAVGVSGFEWLHQGRDWSGRVMISLPAPQNRAYVQTFVNRTALGEPDLTTPGIRDRALEQPNLIVAGYRSRDIAKAYNAEWDEDTWLDRRPETMATSIALVAANKLDRAGGVWTERPSPLYARPADAAPASDPPPVILP
jgi:tRNA threonylcarbamoyl adenosine modification protein YeaZ